MNKILSIFIFLPAFLLSGCYDSGSSLKDNAARYIDSSLTLPGGFTAYVVADNIGHGRHIAVNDNGDIYISLSNLKNNGGIVALRDTNNDVSADSIVYFGGYPGTGIGIHKGYLYFGSDLEVMRYKLKPGELIPDTTRELIATGFPVQYQHATKPFTFDNAGNLYVTVGAPSNACMEQTRTKGSPGMDPCPLLQWHAGIWRFADDKLSQDQQTDGYRYATGIRNAVAIRWNDERDHLYIVQQGRDQLYQFFPDLYSAKQGAELPAEEFFLLADGSDCGWPYCYYDEFQQKKVLAPEYGGDGKEVGRCEGKTDPVMAFPGHLAPNDLLFYTGDQFPQKYKNGAFIAFHGSWNRSPLPQEGFYVVFVPFEGDYPSGKWEVFANGFAETDSIMSPGDAKYRPCGLAQGPDGSLYVVDSNKGKIWKIVYNLKKQD